MIIMVYLTLQMVIVGWENLFLTSTYQFSNHILISSVCLFVEIQFADHIQILVQNLQVIVQAADGIRKEKYILV